MPEAWPFDEPENLAVFTLKRIASGDSPILRVTHDADDGGWQFLDGGEVAIEEASLVAFREMIRLDPSLLELADLPLGWIAERAAPGEPWERERIVTEDDRERKLVSDVEGYGWHVIGIPESDEGPSFAYSIGLFENFEHPEIIVFGLGVETMHNMINLVGEEIRRGRRFVEGDLSSAALEGFDVRFQVFALDHYRDHLGYARWFYEGDDFPALQCLWPDKQGRFPSDPDFSESLRYRQPSFNS